MQRRALSGALDFSSNRDASMVRQWRAFFARKYPPFLDLVREVPFGRGDAHKAAIDLSMRLFFAGKLMARSADHAQKRLALRLFSVVSEQLSIMERHDAAAMVAELGVRDSGVEDMRGCIELEHAAVAAREWCRAQEMNAQRVPANEIRREQGIRCACIAQDWHLAEEFFSNLSMERFSEAPRSDGTRGVVENFLQRALARAYAVADKGEIAEHDLFVFDRLIESILYYGGEGLSYESQVALHQAAVDVAKLKKEMK
jgi:hypothetical protein